MKREDVRMEEISDWACDVANAVMDKLDIPESTIANSEYNKEWTKVFDAVVDALDHLSDSPPYRNYN